MTKSLFQIPGNVTFKNWLMDLNRTLPTLSIPSPPNNTKNWQTWAMLFIQINRNQLPNLVLPLKQNFPKESDWKRWAYFFIQDMYTN